MTKDTGGSAYPQAVATLAPGMTLRDHFAGLAMPLAMNHLRESYNKDLDDDWHWDKEDWEAIAEHSYDMADAMLKARNT